MWSRVKKWLKYLAIVVAGVGAALIYFFVIKPKLVISSKKKDLEGDETFKGVIREIGEKVKEANHQAEVEIAIAQTKDETLKTELQTTLNEKDAKTRRSNLLEMYKRTKGASS
jgi:hypothetical protein